MGVVMKEKGMTTRDFVAFIVILTGLLYSLYSITHELAFRGYCPSVFGVPSSYFYANSFLIMLLATFLINKIAVSFLFNLGLALGIMSSLYFSAMHLLMINISPSYFGITSCYTMFAIFFLAGIISNLKMNV